MSRYDFKLPDIGEGVAEGEVVAWHVRVGDVVKEDQPLVDVMTDKASVTITSPKAGRIAALFGKAGEVVKVHSVLVCREVDLNHDGSKDVFRFYNDEGRTLREEEDRDFDGRIDVITYFEGGDVVRREFDTNTDGMVDMRLYFRDHRAFRAERELQADSSPDFHADYWEFYDTHGNVVRIGWDYDHDGRADRWDRIDRLAPQRPQANASQPSSQPAPPPGMPAAPTAAPTTPTTPATPAAATPTPATQTPATPSATQ